jgi:hypothetical protein
MGNFGNGRTGVISLKQESLCLVTTLNKLPSEQEQGTPIAFS